MAADAHVHVHGHAAVTEDRHTRTVGERGGARRLRGADDERLIALTRAGDADAFGELCRRHEPRLKRLAARILSDPHLAEDIVQEALWRAHRALLRDDRPVAPKAWLAQITRNCALDEIGRRRPQTLVALDDDHPARGGDPVDALGQRAAAHQLLADLTALPQAQRHALVRRELDGVTHEQIAAELQISPGASRNLVHRARTNLTNVSRAREASCTTVQRDLLVAHDERRRASVATYRHLAGCSACRAYRRRLTVTRQVMAGLLLPPGLLLGAALAAKGVLAGVLPATGATSAKPVALAATTALLAGGAVTLGTEIAMPGDPTPLAVQSRALPGHRLEQGERLPRDTAVVSHRVRAGATVPRRVHLRCPAGMVVAGLIPNPDTRISRAYDPSTRTGRSTTAIVNLRADRTLARPAVIATLCRTAIPPAASAARP